LRRSIELVLALSNQQFEKGRRMLVILIGEDPIQDGTQSFLQFEAIKGQLLDPLNLLSSKIGVRFTHFRLFLDVGW
jgi:hypothetical protein